MMRIQQYLCIVAILVFGIFSGCGSIPQSGSATVIKIGALIPLTGNLAETGKTNQYAIEAAVADVNQEWLTSGVGYTLSVVFEDTNSTSAGAIKAITKLKNEGIQYFVGPISSSEVNSIMTYAQANNLVVMSPTSTAPSLSLNDTIFRFALSDTNQAISTGLLMSQENIKVVIPIYGNNIYGQNLLQAFIQSAPITLTVTDGVHYDSIDTFSTVIASLNEQLKTVLATTPTQNVAIYYIGYEEAEQLFEQITNTETKLDSVKWYGSEGINLNGTLKDNSKAATFASKTQFKVFVHISPEIAGFSDSHLPTASAVTALKTKIDQYRGTTSTQYGFTSYDIVRLVGDCLKTARTRDNPTVFMQSLQAMSHYAYGYSGQLALDNQTGDRLTGGYGYYQLVNQNWTLKYIYTLYILGKPGELKAI